MYNLMNKDGLCITKVDSNSVSLNYNRDLAMPFSESQGKKIMRSFPYMGLALIRVDPKGAAYDFLSIKRKRYFTVNG